MKTEYRKTLDPNVFVREDTSESFIHLDKLEAKIEVVQQQINDSPDPKTKPDQETLDYYNMEIGMHGDKEMLEAELKEKKDLRDELKSIKMLGV